MIIKFYFSPEEKTFYNRYPDEQRLPNDTYVEIADVESEIASEFVWHMNRHRFKGNELTLEFVKEKFQSYLSKHGNVEAENESRSEGLVSRGDSKKDS